MKVMTTTLVEGEVQAIDLRITLGRGFAGVSLLGPSSEVSRHGLERAISIVAAAGVELPIKKILLAWTPSDLMLSGSQTDLAIAMALASLSPPAEARIDFDSTYFMAEIGLDGGLSSFRNLIGHFVAAIKAGAKTVVTDMASADAIHGILRLNPELGKNTDVLGFSKFSDVASWGFGGDDHAASFSSFDCSSTDTHQEIIEDVRNAVSFSEMILTEEQLLAAKVAASGRHHLLIRGTPGTGKTMFAERLVGIIGPSENLEILESLSMHGLISNNLPVPLLRGFPLMRSPHHAASGASILGSAKAPGEVALAHGGVLFLDEFPEFRRDVIEGLREPLEAGVVRVARIGKTKEWPARAMIIAAANNCPCGWKGSKKRACHCPGNRVIAYNNRISGPIEERFDIHLNFRTHAKTTLATSVSSKQLATEVAESSRRSSERNKKYGSCYNRDLPASSFPSVLELDSTTLRKLLPKKKTENLTQRSYFRGLKVARSIADVSGQSQVSRDHLDQAFRWSARFAAEDRGDIPPA